MLSKIKGFGIIELMITIAILSVLMMFAIPSYQNYIKRAAFSEFTIYAKWAAGAECEFYSSIGRLPNSNIEAGLSIGVYGKYIKSLVITSNGDIAITGNGASMLPNETVVFTVKCVDN